MHKFRWALFCHHGNPILDHRLSDKQNQTARINSVFNLWHSKYNCSNIWSDSRGQPNNISWRLFNKKFIVYNLLICITMSYVFCPNSIYIQFLWSNMSSLVSSFFRWIYFTMYYWHHAKHRRSKLEDNRQLICKS